MKKTNYTRLIVVIAVCAAVMILLMLLNSIDFNVDVTSWFEKEAETEPISFYIPDYEYEPTEDSGYMAKNRFITYTDPPYSTIITPNINEYGRLGEFFLAYFDALIGGDSEAYNAFFTDAYYQDKDNSPHGEFTKQPVYDIEIEKTSEYTFEEGEYAGMIRYTFRFSYKITRNDGTFRDDMPSNCAVPVTVEVLDDGESVLINSIVKAKTVSD